MKNIRLGILCPSEIASRRFVPALKNNSDLFSFVGVACASEEEWTGALGESDAAKKELLANEKKKALAFADKHGGEVFSSYNDLLASSGIDAVYIPLPPALHEKWGMAALAQGKHLLIEKPCTTDYAATKKLTDFAEQNNLAVHENFAFAFHRQISRLQELLADNIIGGLRQIRVSFGFPYRGAGDFRYHKNMGGGALLDCGGYPLKLAAILLGETAAVTTASLLPAKGHDVDVFGTATVENGDGLTAQISFGMDNSYKCELEIWGSEGTLYCPRIFTPTPEMKTGIIIKKQNEETVLEVDPDDYFVGSQRFFYKCVTDKDISAQTREAIRKQSILMDTVRRMSKQPWN